MGLAGSVGNCFHMSLPRRGTKTQIFHQHSVDGFRYASQIFPRGYIRAYHLMALDGGNRHIFVLLPLSARPFWRVFCCHPNLTFLILTGYVYETWTSINTTTTKDSKITMNVIHHSEKLGNHHILRSPNSKTWNDTTLLSTTEKYISDLNQTFRGITPSGSAPMKLSKLPHQKLFAQKQKNLRELHCGVPSKKIYFMNL